MKILSIAARAVDCEFQRQALQTTRVASPMSRFPRFAAQRSSWMWPTKKVFVRIEAEDGLLGWSCTNGGEIVEMIVNAHLARLLTGEATDDIDTYWDQMVAALLPNDRSGFAMMAVAAADIALWDLKARASSRWLANPLVEFVDRGPDSLLYSLMGPPSKPSGGQVVVPRDGNAPPGFARAAFTVPTIEGT